MPMRVVILSGRSLFAAGVASRLRQDVPRLELWLIDPRQSGAAEQIAAVQPSVVIQDVTDLEVAELLPLQRLLRSFPSLKVIHLDPQQPGVQVITSEQHLAAEVRDLVQMIENVV